MTTFTNQLKTKYPKKAKPKAKGKERKGRLTLWYDIWLTPIIIALSLTQVGVFFTIGGWAAGLGLVIAIIVLALTVGLLYLRWKYWPARKPIYLTGNQLKYGRHLVYDPDPPYVSPETMAQYRAICRRWRKIWQSGDYLHNTEMIPAALEVTEDELYNALRAWRTGRFDNRPWWPRTWDMLRFRHFEDGTRYLP